MYEVVDEKLLARCHIATVRYILMMLEAEHVDTVGDFEIFREADGGIRFVKVVSFCIPETELHEALVTVAEQDDPIDRAEFETLAFEWFVTHDDIDQTFSCDVCRILILKEDKAIIRYHRNVHSEWK